MNPALHGLRVVSFTHGWAGPLVGEILGDFGADVIKVESCRRPDWARGVGPIAGVLAPGEPKLWEWGTTFNGANQSTRSVTLELNTARGKELFNQLVAISDVVVENFTPRVLGQLGLTYDDLCQINPSIILASMPAFGSSGPWGDYVGLAQTAETMGGLTALCGYEGEPPTLQGAAHGDPVAAINGAMAVLMAVRHRRRTGEGQHTEISHIEAMTPHIGGPFMDYVMTKRIQPRRGNRSPVHAPHGCYRSAGEDNWVVITVTSDAEWVAFCEAIGQPGLAQDERFQTVPDRLANQDTLDAFIEEWTSQRDRYDVMKTLQDAGVPAGPVLNAADLLQNEHLTARGFFVQLPKEPMGTHSYPGIPITLSETPGERLMAAPALGQHNEKILMDLLGLSTEDVQLLEADRVIGSEPMKIRDGWIETHSTNT